MFPGGPITSFGWPDGTAVTFNGGGVPPSTDSTAFLPQITFIRDSAGTYDIRQTALVPEPSKLAVVGADAVVTAFALARRKRRVSFPVV
jgi:hypothetical protein